MLDFKNHRYEIAMSVTILRALVRGELCQQKFTEWPWVKKLLRWLFLLITKKKKLGWLKDPLWNIQINNEPCNENFFDLICCTKVMVRNSRKYIKEVIFPHPNLSVNFLDNNTTFSLTERKEANILAIYFFFHMDSIKEEKEISNSKNRGIDPLSHTNTNP